MHHIISFELTNPRNCVVHQEAADQIICVANTARLNCIRGQEESGILNSACRDHRRLCFYLILRTKDGRHFESIETAAVRSEADLRHGRIQQNADIVCLQSYKLAAKPHDIERIEARARELPEEGTEAIHVERRLGTWNADQLPQPLIVRIGTEI